MTDKPTDKSLQAAKKIVKKYHPLLIERDLDPGRPDPADIADHAASYMLIWHSAQFSAYKDEQLMTARVGGHVLYAVHYGLSFEDINSLCGLVVAQLIMRLSPDLRLPATRRQQLVIGEVSAIGTVGQAIKLAEIGLWGLRLVDRAKDANFRRRHKVFLKTWYQTSSTLLSVMSSLHSDVMDPAFHTVQDVLDRLRALMLKDKQSYVSKR